MNVVKIATDSGKKISKFAVLNGEKVDLFKFPTNVITGTDDGLLDDGYVVKFQDVEYLVGVPCSDYNENQTTLSKKTIEHKVSIFTGIALALQKSHNNTPGVKVDITVNMPFLLYKDKHERKEVVDFYMSQPDVSISVDGIDYAFTVNSVTPYYECAGSRINNSNDKLNSSDTIYLDCGSLNTNYAYFKNGKIDPNMSDSLQYGGSKLEKDLESIMYKNGVKGFTDSNLYSFVKGIDLGYTEQQKEALKSAITNYIKKIISDLDSKSINTNNVNMVFSGGAIDVYKKYINAALPLNKNIIISETNVYENALGSLKLISKGE